MGVRVICCNSVLVQSNNNLLPPGTSMWPVTDVQQRAVSSQLEDNWFIWIFVQMCLFTLLISAPCFCPLEICLDFSHFILTTTSITVDPIHHSYMLLFVFLFSIFPNRLSYLNPPLQLSLPHHTILDSIRISTSLLCMKSNKDF